MLDAQAARDYFARGQGDLSNLGRAATAFTWGGGVLADAWPAAPERGHVQPGADLGGGDAPHRRGARPHDAAAGRDDAAPAVPAQRPPGRAAGVRPHATVFREQPEAGSRLINTFFDSGQVDDSLYVPASIDFTPAMTFGAIAKIALGAMLALARADRAVPARNGSPGAHAGPHRAEVRRGAAVGLPARARPGRMVPRRPDRPHDHARRPHRQRSCSSSCPSVCRSASGSTGHGCIATGRPGASVSDSPQRPQARSGAPGWGFTRPTAHWPFSPRLSQPSPAPTSRCWFSTCRGPDPPAISPPQLRRPVRLART